MTTIHKTSNTRSQRSAARAGKPVDPCTIVLFGASGDLTQRMVMPAIFRLARRGVLSAGFRVIGYARTPMSEDAFRALMRKAVLVAPHEGDEAAWADFAAHLSYLSAQYDGDDLQGYTELAHRFEQIDHGKGAGSRRLFYLATPPELFAPIMKHLGDAKLAGQSHHAISGGWARFIIEKPFGHNLSSAQALNAGIVKGFNENDIYRIDHFLGKEIVQNLFALRFANSVFEPVWNRNYIDHVQITAAETLGMEGRGGFYETAGALRDMVQNHLLQLCALVAIEPPSEWNPRAVRDEKVKVLRAVRKIHPAEVNLHAVRGQYAAGRIDGKSVPAYRAEAKVASDSQTETYAALKLYIDNMRWAGVPFYLRSGKRLAKRETQIVVQFKPAPHTPWMPGGAAGKGIDPNLLVINVSPDEGIFMRVEAKQPGQEMQLKSIDLDYCLSDEPEVKESPSAYEHLLLDSLRGDPTFFARADEVEAAWQIVEPILSKWNSGTAPDFPNYSPGSDGPTAGDDLLTSDGRRWYR